MELQQALLRCQFADRCPLAAGATNVNVPSEGADDPEVLFIGMNPGRDEDKQNVPFVGKAGMILRETLDDVGFPEDKARITNVVRCVNWANESRSSVADPPPQAVDLCQEHLITELAKFPRVKYLVTLGGLATHSIAPEVKTVTKAVGSVKKVNLAGKDYNVVPNFHPSYFNYPGFSTNDRQRFVEVFALVKSWVSKVEELTFKTDTLTSEQFIAYARQLLQWYTEGKITKIFYDIETNNPWTSKSMTKSWIWKYGLVSFSIADEINRVGYFVGLDHPELKITPEERRTVLMVLSKVLSTIPVGNQNLKFDMTWSMVHVPRLENYKIADDSYIQSVLIYGLDSFVSHKLKDQTRAVLKVTDVWEEEIHRQIYGHRLIKDRHLWNVKLETLQRYGGVDAIAALELSQAFNKVIDERGLRRIYDMVLRGIRVMSLAEVKGISIDAKMLEMVKPKYLDAVINRTLKFCYLPTVRRFIFDRFGAENIEVKEIAGEEIVVNKDTGKDTGFNTNSTPQMVELFFTPQYYNFIFNPKYRTEPTQSNPDGGLSFNKDVRAVLAREAGEGERKWAVDLIGQIKSLTTALTKYYKPLPNLSVEQPDGSLSFKPDFSFTTVATGRLGSFFHTFPKRGEVKRLVISRWKDEGGLIMSPDFSQVEIRVIGALAGDERLKEIYMKGFDVHRYVASVIFHKPMEKVSKMERFYAKNGAVFAVLYQKTAKNLAEDLNMTLAEAQNILNWFYEGFPRLAEWQEKIKQEVKLHGYVRSAFGRYRFFPEFRSQKKGVIGDVERGAVNFPVQSAASDIALESLICLQESLESIKAKSFVLGGVHDSIIIDVHPEEVIQVMKLGRQNLVTRVNDPATYPWLNGMPIAADFAIGGSWLGALEYDTEDYEHFKFKGREKDVEETVMLLSKHYNVTVSDSEETEEDDDEGFKVLDFGRMVKGKMRIVTV